MVETPGTFITIAELDKLIKRLAELEAALGRRDALIGEALSRIDYDPGEEFKKRVDAELSTATKLTPDSDVPDFEISFSRQNWNISSRLTKP